MICEEIVSQACLHYNLTMLCGYKQVSVSSGIGQTEGPEFEMPLKL